ncbi:tetratricopeptide repeat protein [Conchiformibius steedae DSM 2580]|uniref:Uncharacterized protein n=2 Tax=Conchiformibius steedae TaxID=153493 RepID=A0A3P2A719_9NEIS|nr:tetratricopeptide repeat protein [Conchiformibius steedae]QMT32700.1 tetratricopeptide repeat protein [Conchiformibius steedae]RRD91191.1 hypothetical protein EII21_02015 [Conchiformibius steedae]URD67309.1 tetratricopeptide repeat protein [Conchiformibius steedae DSM 2580]
MKKTNRLLTLCALSPLTACVGVAPMGVSSYPAPIRNPVAERLNERPLQPVAVSPQANAAYTAAQAPYRLQPLPAAQTAVVPANVRPVAVQPQPVAVVQQPVAVLPQPVPLTATVPAVYAGDPVYLEQQKQIHLLTTQNIQLRQQVDYLSQRLEQIERHRAPVALVPQRPNKKKTPPPVRKTQQVVRIPPENITPDMSAYRSKMTDPTEENLKLARQQFRRGDYKGVLHTLRGIDGGGNGSTAARHSMYLLLQTNLRLNHCQSVIQIGQRLASRYANSPEAAEALYTVGECQRGIQQQDIARDTWRKLISSYPNSPAARRARSLLKI